MERNGWIRILTSQWRILAQRVGTFQSRMLLSLFYFLIIPPFAAIIKVFSDPFRSKDRLATQWHPKQAPQQDPLQAARRQF